jgi:signal transduction histidine kinase
MKNLFKKKDPNNKSWPVKKTVFTCTLLIISISFALFFYFQHQTESEIKESIFEKQQNNQIDKTKAIAENVESTLNLIMAKLEGLSTSEVLQQGNFQSANAGELLNDRFEQINDITPIDRLFLIDKNGTSKMNVAKKGLPPYIGVNFHHFEWIRELKDSLSPAFSDIYTGIDGKHKIGLAYPVVVNSTKGGHIGSIVVVMPASEFFKHFGNIYDIRSPYLSVLDSKAVQIVHPLPELVGKPFFGEEIQEITGHNEGLNNHLKTVLGEGKPSSLIYNFKNDERLNTGYPIILNGVPHYSLFVISPTSNIYSKINEIILTERLQMFSLIAGIAAAITILILFLTRWNNMLDKEVKFRTKELEESNKQISLANKKLESANMQLQNKDKMQREFINIAAHELRTPIQPILGLTEIVKNKTKDSDLKDLLATVIKNANRLKKLSEDVLDVTKIESNTLDLNKERFNLFKLLFDIIKELQNNTFNNKKINFEYNFTNSESIIVYADKNRVSQVVSNLISNSIKFIQKDGVISIGVDKIKKAKNDGNGSKIAVVEIKDTGIGIDKEIIAKLFTKFTTKSFQGTGLGLYISKNIIEAHGGRIWAENNKEGYGSTFSFYLPVEE